MIVVIGASLAGMATAARLARVGHEVVIIERQPSVTLPPLTATLDGERSTPGAGARREGRRSVEEGWTGALSPLDDDPHVVVLPAAWRDLFKKSGQPLVGALGQHQLQLVPAPPASYPTTDGRLLLPTDRAGQWHTLVDAFGPQLATAWRDLLDRLDTTWLTLRQLGVEAEFAAARLDRATKAALRTDETLADLARQVGPLGTAFTDLAVRRDSNPRRTPGWLGTRLSLERTFGRWQLVDATGTPRPAARLRDVLLQRLADRGVELRWATEAHQVSPGLVRTSGGDLHAQAVVVTTSPWQHATLTGGHPPRRLSAASTTGPQWHGWRTLLDLPRLHTPLPGVYVASAFSPAGPEPWAQLLTGALAAYRVHAELTGQDMRPANKAWRPPPLRRQARTVISTSTNMSDSLGPE